MPRKSRSAALRVGILRLTGLALAGLVPTHHAAGGSAHKSMVAHIMTGDPADHGSLQATLCIGRPTGTDDASEHDRSDGDFCHPVISAKHPGDGNGAIAALVPDGAREICTKMGHR